MCPGPTDGPYRGLTGPCTASASHSAPPRSAGSCVFCGIISEPLLPRPRLSLHTSMQGRRRGWRPLCTLCRHSWLHDGVGRDRVWLRVVRAFVQDNSTRWPGVASQVNKERRWYTRAGRERPYGLYEGRTYARCEATTGDSPLGVSLHLLPVTSGAPDIVFNVQGDAEMADCDSNRTRASRA